MAPNAPAPAKDSIHPPDSSSGKGNGGNSSTKRLQQTGNTSSHSSASSSGSEINNSSSYNNENVRNSNDSKAKIQCNDEIMKCNGGKDHVDANSNEAPGGLYTPTRISA